MTPGDDRDRHPLDTVFARWAAGQQQIPAGETDLPPHHSTCLGCGPGNPHGHHLQVRRDGDRVAAEHVFDARHMGAPGVAHGGALATVIDDLYGFLLYVVGELAVTRSLHVEYLAPIRLGIEYHLWAELERREGRMLHLRAQVADPAGRITATSNALFLTVTVDHFVKAARSR